MAISISRLYNEIYIYANHDGVLYLNPDEVTKAKKSRESGTT